MITVSFEYALHDPIANWFQGDAVAMARIVRQDLAVPELLISQVCLPMTAGASTAPV
jgi:hypothetical protein